MTALGGRDAGLTAQVVMTRQGSLHGPGGQLDAFFETRIEVPPIRHRGDDIAQLVRHFLRRYRPDGAMTCPAAALAALQQCP